MSKFNTVRHGIMSLIRVKSNGETIKEVYYDNVVNPDYTNIEVGTVADLGEKAITANGVYNASADNLDGYSKVTVEIESVPLTLIPEAPDGADTVILKGAVIADQLYYPTLDVEDLLDTDVMLVKSAATFEDLIDWETWSAAAGQSVEALKALVLSTYGADLEQPAGVAVYLTEDNEYKITACAHKTDTGQWISVNPATIGQYILHRS